MYRRLRPHLARPVRHFWDRHTSLLESGLIWQGATHRLAAATCAALRTLFGPDFIADLSRIRTPQQTDEFFARHVYGNRVMLVASVLRSVLAEHPLRAMPPARSLGVSALAPVTLAALHDHLRRHPLAGNQYLYPLLFRRFATPDATPPYLAPSFHATSSACTDRIRLVHADLRQYLREAPPASFDCFALSNVIDWIDPTDVPTLIADVVRVARNGGRAVLFARSARLRIPPSLRSRVHVRDDLSHELLREDRVGYFRRLWVLEVTHNHGRPGATATAPSTRRE